MIVVLDFGAKRLVLSMTISTSSVDVPKMSQSHVLKFSCLGIS